MQPHIVSDSRSHPYGARMIGVCRFVQTFVTGWIEDSQLRVAVHFRGSSSQRACRKELVRPPRGHGPQRRYSCWIPQVLNTNKCAPTNTLAKKCEAGTLLFDLYLRILDAQLVKLNCKLVMSIGFCSACKLTEDSTKAIVCDELLLGLIAVCASGKLS